MNTQVKNKPPIKKVWIAAIVANTLFAVRGVMFYKNNPYG